jgi:hypothetical protein
LENGAMFRERFPTFSLITPNVKFTRDNFQTLMDVVIVNSTCTNMVQWTLIMTTHVMMMTAHEKTWSYVERALGNDFIPLVIEMYGCLHSHFDSYLTICA